MSTFQQTLKTWLCADGNTQDALASAIGKTQVAVSRYASGERFPDAQTARAIDAHTRGEVPFEVWQAEFLARSGLAA